jgi:hypothetical protein
MFPEADGLPDRQLQLRHLLKSARTRSTARRNSCALLPHLECNRRATRSNSIPNENIRPTLRANRHIDLISTRRKTIRFCRGDARVARKCRIAAPHPPPQAASSSIRAGSRLASPHIHQ